MSDIDNIKNTGVPVSAQTGVTSAITGSKAKFAFTCLKCQSKYETASEYATADNVVQTAAKREASYGVSSILYSILGRIPVLGSIISSMASTVIYETVNAASGNRFEKARDKAFEEVQGKFQPCSKCGQYGCVSCIKDGLCPSCKPG